MNSVAIASLVNKAVGHMMEGDCSLDEVTEVIRDHVWSDVGTTGGFSVSDSEEHARLIEEVESTTHHIITAMFGTLHKKFKGEN